MISYNVTVIFLKTILQMAGCLFMDALSSHACWAVQLFGVACIKKFGVPAIPRGAFGMDIVISFLYYLYTYSISNDMSSFNFLHII